LARSSSIWVFYGPYRDKRKLSGVFVRFRALKDGVNQIVFFFFGLLDGSDALPSANSSVTNKFFEASSVKTFSMIDQWIPANVEHFAVPSRFYFNGLLTLSKTQ
jgi:hypothetical protein